MIIAKLKQLINSGLTRIRTHDLCDTSALLYQLSYQVDNLIPRVSHRDPGNEVVKSTGGCSRCELMLCFGFQERGLFLCSLKLTQQNKMMQTQAEYDCFPCLHFILGNLCKVSFIKHHSIVSLCVLFSPSDQANTGGQALSYESFGILCCGDWNRQETLTV